MKKVSILVLVAGIALLAGCAKEPSDAVEVRTAQVTTLTAVFPESPTKTAIDSKDNTKVIWVEGDKIGVFGDQTEKNEYENDVINMYGFSLTDGAGTAQGAFTGTLPLGNPAYAVYPYDERSYMVDPVNPMIGAILPSVQVVPAGSFDPAAALMVGTVEDGVIKFKHAVGYLKVIAPADVSSLTSIVIELNDGSERLSGGIVYNPASIREFFYDLGEFMDESDVIPYRIIVKPAEGKFIAGAAYYVALPPREFMGGLNITYVEVTKSLHQVSTTGYTSWNEKDLDVVPGHVTTVPEMEKSIESFVRKGTQLWENGPYFADVNVGATITSYDEVNEFAGTNDDKSISGFKMPYITEHVGGLYPFHYPRKNAHIVTWSVPSDPFEGDVARYHWGTEWREPTKDELDALIDGLKDGPGTGTDLGLVWTWCDGSTVKYQDGCTLAGYKISGKVGSDYENASIFLPAAGVFVSGLSNLGSQGLYWTSDEKPGEGWYVYVYQLNFGDSYQNDNPYNREQGNSVRAVLAE